MSLSASLLPFGFSWASRLAASALSSCTTRVDGSHDVYLTFDDGPHPDTTPDLLDRLAAQGAGATFFLLGRAAAAYPHLVRAILDAGHTVGQHSDSHLDPWRTRKDVMIAEMDRATKIIEDVTGEPVGWMRPPYGHVTGALLRWARERGQAVALWDVMPGDFLATASPESVIRATCRLVRPGSLVVMHDGPSVASVTPAAVDRIAPALHDAGYRCERL